MRDALSLTDQAIAYAAGADSLEAVQGMLGALDQTYLVRLLDALLAQDGADLMAVADEMASRSLSYNNALQDLGTLLHRIALAQSVPAAVPQDLPELADILRLAGAFDPQEVQLYYQIAVHGRNEIGLAPDEYAGFTMTLLRMLAFRPGNGGADAAGPATPAARPTASPARAAAAAAAAPVRPAAAAAAAVASHSAVPVAPPPPRPPAPVQAAARATAPAQPASAPAAGQGAAAPAMNSARAAINAALEAARAASRGQSGGAKRPTAMSNQAAAAAAAAPAPVMPAPSAPVAPQAAAAAPPWDSPAAPAEAPRPRAA